MQPFSFSYGPRVLSTATGALSYADVSLSNSRDFAPVATSTLSMKVRGAVVCASFE